MMAEIPRGFSKRVGGFTLVEIMAVIAIIGILAAIVVPTVFHSVEKARNNAGDAGMAQIEALLDQFYLEEEEYPDTLGALVEKGYTKKIPLTGEGNNYQYKKISPDDYSIKNPD